MTLLFPLMWPVILTQSWTGLEINPILEIPIMKIAKNLYQPAELTWSIASTIYMRSNSFSVDSQSHLPHSGRPDLGLIIANLQLNWVPGTSPQTTLILFLLTLYFVFQALLPYRLTFSKAQMAVIHGYKKMHWVHIPALVWMGKRYAMRAGSQIRATDLWLFST